MGRHSARISKFISDSNGNILPMTAAGIFLATAIIGGGVDISRAYKAKTRLQSACDSAVMAGRRAVTTQGFNAAAQTQAQSFFDTNYDEATQYTSNTAFLPTSPDGGSTVNATASTRLDTALMRIFGVNTMNLAVACSASMGVGNSDVTMVLDTTGSMDNTLSGTSTTRIQALRAAMKNFYTTVATATSGSNARIRYGFVPYSSSINVGHLIYDENPAYLVDSYAIQSRVAVNKVSPPTQFDYFLYQQVTYNVSAYKTFTPVSTRTADNGAMVTSTWAGCIEERASVASPTFLYTALLGITPTGATDLDIDTAPSTLASTKWAPMWPEVAYYRTVYVPSRRGGGSYYLSNSATSTTGGQASYACPHRAQLLTAMSQSNFNTFADELAADGNTYHDLGMIWGARISSPDGIFDANVNIAPSNGGSVSRHLIFMTDGDMNTYYAEQSTYGIEYHDRRVTTDGYTDSDERHTARFLAVCEAVKAKGIRLWVIAFSSTLTTELSTCASSGSSFTASNSTQLNTAFQEIAKQVGELRITQ